MVREEVEVIVLCAVMLSDVFAVAAGECLVAAHAQCQWIAVDSSAVVVDVAVVDEFFPEYLSELVGGCSDNIRPRIRLRVVHIAP